MERERKQYIINVRGHLSESRPLAKLIFRKSKKEKKVTPEVITDWTRVFVKCNPNKTAKLRKASGIPPRKVLEGSLDLVTEFSEKIQQLLLLAGPAKELQALADDIPPFALQCLPSNLNPDRRVDPSWRRLYDLLMHPYMILKRTRDVGHESHTIIKEVGKRKCPFCGADVSVPKEWNNWETPIKTDWRTMRKHCTLQHDGQVLFYHVKEKLEFTTWDQLTVKNVVQRSLLFAGQISPVNINDAMAFFGKKEEDCLRHHFLREFLITYWLELCRSLLEVIR